MSYLEAILEKHAFINMLESGLESYNCEIYGSIYGEKVTDRFYIIQNALPSVTAKRRPEKVTEISKFLTISRGMKFPDNDYLGDYHSHPNDWPRYSKIDKKDMKYDRSLLYIICSITPMKQDYRARKWRTKNKLLTGTLSGIYDFKGTRYVFMFALYYFKHGQVQPGYGKPKLAKLRCPYAEQLGTSIL